jgi:2-polyprenyl-3-methyl-5-hydroxy-6-metoxy-1,4-benzoquinol methylase
VLGQPETISEKFDMLVCLETIEHLPDYNIIKDLVDRCRINEIIISFPNKKTTHYNKYHLWDISKEDVIRLFNNYQCYTTKDMDDSTIMNFIRIERNGYTPKKYLN